MAHSFFHFFDNQQPGSFFGPPLEEGQRAFDFFGRRTGDIFSSNPNSSDNNSGPPRFSPGAGKPRPGDDTGRGFPQGLLEGGLDEQVERLHKQTLSDRDAAADAASLKLVETATATRESLQDRIDSLTGIFLDNRITNEEIARRDTVQADIILGEMKALLSQKASDSSLRGLTGGGAASASSAIVKGAGIGARAKARGENIEFQKDFNAKLSLAVEGIKANLDAAEAQLNTSLGLAKAQIELGRPINFEVLMAAILDVEAVETGREKFDEIMQLSRDFAESAKATVPEFLLDALSNALSTSGAANASTFVSTVNQGIGAFG